MAFSHQGVRHDLPTSGYVSNSPRYSNRNQPVTSGSENRQQNMYRGAYPEYDNDEYLVPNVMKNDLSGKSGIQDPQSQVCILFIYLMKISFWAKDYPTFIYVRVGGGSI